jgi:PAS domain S-box-containing protein
MKGKILIVEDEPIVALDLQQEVEQLGLTVVALAESADEALLAAEENRPDLALMDVRIVGSMDGVQTARLLRDAYEVPVIFLTSYSDESTIRRAAREMPYGYLTKPFQPRELRAALEVGLHREKTETQRKRELNAVTTTIAGMREGVLLLSAAREVQFINTAAEDLTGWAVEDAKGKTVDEVLNLGVRNDCLPQAGNTEAQGEEFGLSLERNGGGKILIDLSVSALRDHGGERTGWVVTLRDAAERLRTQAVEEALEEGHSFHTAPIAMMQLDASGCIVRVNKTLLEETGVEAECLVGRTLTGLSMDPDPRIARDLLHRLLQGGAQATTSRPHAMN